MTVAGDLDTEQFIASLQKRLGSSKWTDTHISVQSISNKPVDVGSIRRDLQDDLARASMQQRDELLRRSGGRRRHFIIVPVAIHRSVSNGRKIDGQIEGE